MRQLGLGLVLLLASTSIAFGAPQAGSNAIRPQLTPEPAAVQGVAKPVIALDGMWKAAVAPTGEYWRNDADLSTWRSVQVPNLGSELPRDHLVFKTQVNLPSDFSNKRVLLRFEGVSGQAKLWVNGAPVREHWGGFMAWTADITDQIKPGQPTWLTVAIDDRRYGLAAAVRGGGIHRSVKLMAEPQNYLSRLHVDTDLDAAYQDATLKVALGVSFHTAAKTQVRLALKDAVGRDVPISPGAVEIDASAADRTVEIPVKGPLKWDAEHPNLYRLEASVIEEGLATSTLVRSVGFRKLERVGNRVLINGQEVKFRGLWDGDNVSTLRAANINHSRQKWATEAFLDEADRLGLYVLDEVPIDFAINGAQDDPKFASQYMSLTADLIERDRSHPSVVIWGTGNESWYGPNVAKTLQYANTEDPGRLSFFSWGNRAPAGEPPPYSVYSWHYANWDENLGQAPVRMMADVPVLHDEYAHIAWYNHDTQRGDPNVHNFWGESIARFWATMMATPGALGGDIFAFRYFQTKPEEKPEYWLMKKAYSPVRIAEKPLASPGSGQVLKIPVKNWFDHTNLNEVRVRWAVGSQSEILVPPDVAPHGEGVLTLPARDWRSGDIVNLDVLDRDARLIDSYRLEVDPKVPALSGFQGPAPRVQETAATLTVAGRDFSVMFDKTTGLIINGAYKGVQVIKDGPFLHLNGTQLGAWSLSSMSYVSEKDRVVVTLKGSAVPVDLTFRISIDASGLIVTNYTFAPLPQMTPPMVQNAQMRDVGGYKEIGVSFLLSEKVDHLAWTRHGLWSVYPEGHIGRNSGTAYRLPRDPTHLTWSDSDRDPELFGPYDVGGRGTRDFRSLKENIYAASAILGASGASLRAESNGQDAVRLEVTPRPDTLFDDADPRLTYTGQWEHLWSQPGRYKSTTSVGGDPGSSVSFTFEGQGVVWTGGTARSSGQAGAEDAGLGRTGPASGRADVYIDGRLEAADLELSRQVEHRYSDVWPLALFSKQGLSDGRHTIKIVVKSPGVPLDRFEVLRQDAPGDVRLVYANQWNYPDLSWGNYVKRPQLTGTFYQNAARVRLAGVPGVP